MPKYQWNVEQLHGRFGNYIHRISHAGRNIELGELPYTLSDPQKESIEDLLDSGYKPAQFGGGKANRYYIPKDHFSSLIRSR